MPNNRRLSSACPPFYARQSSCGCRLSVDVTQKIQHLQMRIWASQILLVPPVGVTFPSPPLVVKETLNKLTTKILIRDDLVNQANRMYEVRLSPPGEQAPPNVLQTSLYPIVLGGRDHSGATNNSGRKAHNGHGHSNASYSLMTLFCKTQTHKQK